MLKFTQKLFAESYFFIITFIFHYLPKLISIEKLSSKTNIHTHQSSGTINSSDSVEQEEEEEDEGQACPLNMFRCENGPCIDQTLRCNGIIDCPLDISDELDCDPICKFCHSITNQP